MLHTREHCLFRGQVLSEVKTTGWRSVAWTAVARTFWAVFVCSGGELARDRSRVSPSPVCVCACAMPIAIGNLRLLFLLSGCKPCWPVVGEAFELGTSVYCELCFVRRLFPTSEAVLIAGTVLDVSFSFNRWISLVSFIVRPAGSKGARFRRAVCT